MNDSLLGAAVMPLVAAFVVSCAPGHPAGAPAGNAPRVVTAAVVEMYPARQSDVHGLLHFRAAQEGVLLRGNVTKLKAGLYGLRLHETGDCSAFDAKPVGATSAPNGSPRTDGRLDDLVVEHDGGGEIDRMEAKLTLSGPDSVVGKSLVVEAWPYDPKTDPATVPAVACGVVREE
jgi:superoxide dismutase, Cu-Zn family